MIEPIGVTTGLYMLGLLNQIAQAQKGRIKSISASFEPDGIKLEGDKRIQVVKEGAFFRVNRVKDYEFLRVPVNPSSVIELLGTDEDGFLDSDRWRWVRAPLPNEKRYHFSAMTTSPSVRVRFMVFGYRPNDFKKILGKG